MCYSFRDTELKKKEKENPFFKEPTVHAVCLTWNGNVHFSDALIQFFQSQYNTDTWDHKFRCLFSNIGQELKYNVKPIQHNAASGARHNRPPSEITR